MADSFVISPQFRHQPSPRRRKVLVTGAAGHIGSYFAERCHESYELTLMVRPQTDAAAIRNFGRVELADLGDLDRLRQLFAGQDTIVHLAANPSPSASWGQLLPNNIVGTYNVFVAAEEQHCRRVIFASSIHAVSGYPQDWQVHADQPVNPGDLYGVSKCFGEAMARYMAVQQDLSAIVLRIGAFTSTEDARRPESAGILNAFVSRRDLNQLIVQCIDNEDLKFAIFHGLSNNRFNRMDISEARELVGYEPKDDLAELNPELKKTQLSEVVTHSEKGGRKSGLDDSK